MFPTIFAIETVLGCNLRCCECAIGANLVRRKYGVMSHEHFIKITAKIKNYCSYAYLHLWGEPMINPEIISIIQTASQFTKTNISTNANNLDKSLAKALICSGVSDIIVSIDGITQDTYSIYRRRGVLEKALLGLTYLVKYSLINNRRISIVPQFIVFEHNKHEMKEFGDFCTSLGLVPSFKAPYIRNNSLLKSSGIPLYTREREREREREVDRKTNMRLCNIHNVCTILLDGSVVACCYDHNGVTHFGNIFQNSLEEIWNSKKFVDFRNSLKNSAAPKFCMENCLLY